MAAAEKRRRPWLAALMSLIAPGLGQLYNGQIHRALFFLAALTGLTVFLLATLHSRLTAESFVFLVIQVAAGLTALGLQLAGIVDAFIQSRRLQAIRPRWFNRWYVYLPAFVLATAPSAAMDPGHEAAEPFSAMSGSMAPTLQAGDFFYSDKSRDRPLRRGEVIVFRLPSGIDYVQRLVGLPGDTVQMRGGRLYINGSAIQRELKGDYADGDRPPLKLYRESWPGRPAHSIAEQSDRNRLDDTESFAVPPGHIFVLGDNRDNSLDSRTNDVGFVPMENVVGRVTYIFWSRDLGRIGRWVE